MGIQWYPGHMTKTRRIIERDIALVDVVLEALDARAPQSSRNPDIMALTRGKRHIVVLNKADLASERATALWREYYEGQGLKTVAVSSAGGKGGGKVMEAVAEVISDKAAAQRERGRVGSTTRAIVLGVPNVGKSTMINRYAGRSAAIAADKPGVTRGKQWVKVSPGLELLDTPGILWPDLGDPEVGVKLAVTGAIKDTILDIIELAWKCISLLRGICPEALKARYKIEFDGDAGDEDVLTSIGKARGFLRQGGRVDLERAAVTLIDEFRGGKLGRVTLELPPN